jgi:hypothetical protein
MVVPYNLANKIAVEMINAAIRFGPDRKQKEKAKRIEDIWWRPPPLPVDSYSSHSRALECRGLHGVYDVN